VIKMMDSKSKRKPENNKKGGSKRTQAEKQKIEPKLLAIALIFIMLFVSYVVIFAGQNNQSSKNMVFSEDQEELGTWYGKVEEISAKNLSDVKLKIKDSSADSSKSTDFLEDGTVLETEGNFNCTFFDKNKNGELDENDEFVVHNASSGDWIKLHLVSTGKEIAYYIF
jgi:hypothetical protein